MESSIFFAEVRAINLVLDIISKSKHKKFLRLAFYYTIIK